MQYIIFQLSCCQFCWFLIQTQMVFIIYKKSCNIMLPREQQYVSFDSSLSFSRFIIYIVIYDMYKYIHFHFQLGLHTAKICLQFLLQPPEV